MEETTLVELWRRCAQLERERDWTELSVLVEPRLRRYLSGSLARLNQKTDEALLDDLRQDVYCRLLDRGKRAFRRCRAQTDIQLLAYLKRICESVVLDYCRGRYASKRGLVDSDQSPIGAQVVGVVDYRRSPEDALLSDQLRRRLRRCLVWACRPDLAPRNGWIFECAVVDGWTSLEIARRVGLRPSSVDSLVHRMKQRLGDCGLLVPDRC